MTKEQYGNIPCISNVSVVLGEKMKKLFFIVLTVVILMVAGSFIKEMLRQQAENQSNSVALVDGCDCNVERVCEDGDQVCQDKMVECGCNIDAENSVEEVVEDHPELTSDEDETIVSE